MGGSPRPFEANLGLALGVARARQPSSRGRIRVSLKARDEPSTASAKLADRAAYSSPELRTEARGAHVNKNVRLLHAQGDAAAAHGRDEPAAPEHGVAAAVRAARGRGRRAAAGPLELAAPAVHRRDAAEQRRGLVAVDRRRRVQDAIPKTPRRVAGAVAGPVAPVHLHLIFGRRRARRHELLGEDRETVHQ